MNLIFCLFPTAEGFYDYRKSQYIYQYKDHLGNVRLSYGRDINGNLEIVDANNYFPFGMSHLNSGTANFGTGSYKNYKYNGKELQETGMYDYGARFYMPDIGRWGVIDPLAEVSKRWTPYNYAYNNPIRNIDPDGNAPEDTIETGCCPDPPVSDVDVAWEFTEMIAGGINSVRASVSNLVARTVNVFTGDKINNKYEVENGSLVLVTGVPKESGREKLVNTIGDLATIGLSVAGGPEGMLMAQGGKAPVLKGVQDIKNQAKSLISAGRVGKQERLKQLSNDPKLGKADKGWIKSEMNQISNGNRKSIRNPPGKDLAHERGREAAKGYSYEYSHLQNRKDHRNQHKYDNGGRKNKERPVN